jgi:hypothetical protein
MNKLDYAVALIGGLADQARSRGQVAKAAPKSSTAPVDARMLEALAGLSHAEARDALTDIPADVRRRLQRDALRGSLTRSGGTIQIGEQHAVRPAPVRRSQDETIAPGAFAESIRARRTASPKGRIRQALDAGELERLRVDYANHPGLVARHEAGHTLVAWALARGVQHVEIGFSGHCGLTRLSREVDDPQEALMLLSAGMLAERGHRAWDPAYEKIWPHNDDHHRVGEWWSYLDLSAVDEGRARSRVGQQVQELLDRHRRLVDDVAGELQQRRRLNSDDLARLLPRRAIRADLVPMLGAEQ